VLLYLPLIIGSIIYDDAVRENIQRLAPMAAGMAIQNSDSSSGPIGPWWGLGVLAGWAVAALIAGLLTLVLRDA
jgi:ABC-2 type transport system permease protein